MQPTTRQATVEDIDELINIGLKTYRETFASFYPQSVMNQYLNEAFSVDKLKNELQHDQSQFWLLEIEGTCAGYLKVNWGNAQTEMQDESGLEVERIYLALEYKGKGFGKLLFEKAREIAKTLNRSYMWLGVWENNQQAIAFYKSQGFVVAGTHNFQMGDICDTDYIMTLALADG
tara:strand:+ start:3505 stop:4029 length:525 start_codon:yes stop_codon:yes gene_type:complete